MTIILMMVVGFLTLIAVANVVVEIVIAKKQNRKVDLIRAFKD